MESLYGVFRAHKTNLDWASAGDDQNLFKTLCSVSTTNIIAFTSTTETSDSSETSLGFHVYVADINTPWHAYKVTSNAFPISVLEWDVLGKYLLIGDVSGSVQIWIQKECLVSEWVQLYSVHFPGEHILKAVFFHNGKKTQLVSEKKDQPLYMEKFQRVKFSPSVPQFGGVPLDGVLIISFTGMLGAFVIPPEPPTAPPNSSTNSYNLGPYTLPSVTESIAMTRNYYSTADISYGKNGQFLVAVSSGTIKVQYFQVVVKKVDDRITITSKSFPSFFMAADEMDHFHDLRIEKLKWISHEDGDSLIVAANHTAGSLIQIWGLVEKTTPIHKLFQSNKSEMFKTIDWANQAQVTNIAKMLDVCTSKLSFGTPSFIVVTLDNLKIQCLHADTLREIAEDNLFVWADNQNDQRTKLFCSGPQITAVDVTWMGQLMILVDTKGQIYAHRLLFSHQDHHQPQQPFPELHILTLLEYCLVTSYDYLDILLNVKIPYIDNLVDRLTENFNRQPNSVQQYYYVNFLTMKTNLYRLSISGQAKAHDLTNLLMLHSILITFKSLLRPSDLTCHDKGPAESLALVLSESVPDVDKVLLNLEGKDFTVEPSTLQSLQQLIQWVADLALNILAKLPESRCLVGQPMKNSGYEISKDIVALNSIRELLVMIRIWGLLKPQCLPVFSGSAHNLDILSALFRTLTRLALSPNEPDEMLLDECCMLPSQVIIPQLQSPVINPRIGLMSPVLQFNNPPLKFTFGIEPESLKFCPELPIVEGGLAFDNITDSVRHVQLGKQPRSIRKCSRCGACSSVSSIARTAALRAWEQRWGNRCWCGGFWALKTFSSD